MISVIRRFVAVLSGCGLAASAVVYVGSYVGTTMDSISRLAIVLHLGVFMLMLPMFAVEYPGLVNRSFFWKGFKQGRPRWVVPGVNVLGVFFMLHFVLFLVQSHAAAPEIINGQYVLNNHGQIVKVLTQSEYSTLKGAELRIFATGWMFFLLRAHDVLVVSKTVKS
jgi:hypothetical protein